MHTVAILADVIDNTTNNGTRALGLIRNVIFPLVIAALALGALARSRGSWTAPILILVAGAFAWVPIFHPEYVGNIASAIF